MSLMCGPERYSAPPVEICTIPSLPASAKPWSAALSVCDDDTLIAGNANDFALAVSSISAYFSGVATGMRGLLGRTRADVPNPSPPNEPGSQRRQAAPSDRSAYSRIQACIAIAAAAEALIERVEPNCAI